jgi:hypothetical protein
MINNYFARGASATALMLALATMPANAQEALPAIDVGVAQGAMRQRIRRRPRRMSRRASRPSA